MIITHFSVESQRPVVHKTAHFWGVKQDKTRYFWYLEITLSGPQRQSSALVLPVWGVILFCGQAWQAVDPVASW